MDGGVGYTVALALGVVAVVLLSRILFRPVRQLTRLVLKVATGTLLVILFNAMGARFGLYVPLNPVTLATVTLLRTPGLALVIALQNLLS